MKRYTDVLPNLKEGAEFTIVIKDWHPTPLNKLINSHWSKANLMKKKSKLIVWAYSVGCPKATRKRSVKLIIGLKPKQRACDPDSYNKDLLDSLVACELLVNDSHKWVVIEPVEYQRGEMKTIITLRDL